MVKESKYIRDQLLKNYPELIKQNIWLTDPFYLLPELKDLEESIKRNSVKDIKYYKSISECEEFSLFLHARIKMERAKNAKNIPDSEKYTWAFGEATGYRSGLMGKSIHQMCICFTQDGIKIIEPQSDRIENLDINKFNIFFVKM